MENKKGSTGVVVSIILVVVFLIAVVVLVFVLSNEGAFKPKPELSIESIPFFVMPRDAVSLDPVEANYILEYTNEEGQRIIVSQGKLDDSWNELSAPKNYRLTMTCWNDDHYLVKAYKDHTEQEKLANMSKLTCDMEKIGDLTISHTGSISGTQDSIFVNISTDDAFYKTSMCFSWTSGILDVGLVNQYAICDSGSWLNWSEYDPDTLEFTYLPNDTYRCGEDRIEICEFIEGTRCKVSNENIPIRFKEKADSCVYTGKSLRSESYKLELQIRSFEYKNSLDYVDIYFYDKDRRWDELEQKWVWKSELNGEDLGSPDQVYRIEYGN